MNHIPFCTTLSDRPSRSHLHTRCRFAALSPSPTGPFSLHPPFSIAVCHLPLRLLSRLVHRCGPPRREALESSSSSSCAMTKAMKCWQQQQRTREMHTTCTRMQKGSTNMASWIHTTGRRSLCGGVPPSVKKSHKRSRVKKDMFTWVSKDTGIHPTAPVLCASVEFSERWCLCGGQSICCCTGLI